MPQDLTDDKSTVLWVMACCRQAITWANGDPDLCRPMASLGLNELDWQRAQSLSCFGSVCGSQTCWLLWKQFEGECLFSGNGFPFLYVNVFPFLWVQFCGAQHLTSWSLNKMADISQVTFSNVLSLMEIVDYLLIEISLKFGPGDQIDNMSALIQISACSLFGTKALPLIKQW